ncbi:hypothetical protein M885DRAFT_627151, partial [Pelagophyceae sp. CCMP2097]
DRAQGSDAHRSVKELCAARAPRPGDHVRRGGLPRVGDGRLRPRRPRVGAERRALGPFRAPPPCRRRVRAAHLLVHALVRPLGRRGAQAAAQGREAQGAEPEDVRRRARARQPARARRRAAEVHRDQVPPHRRQAPRGRRRGQKSHRRVTTATPKNKSDYDPGRRLKTTPTVKPRRAAQRRLAAAAVYICLKYNLFL